MEKKFEILFFGRGKRKPAKKFLFSLSRDTRAKALRLFDLLEDYGLLVGMPYAKKITSQLFELRIRGKEEVRFLFTIKGRTIIILHGFKKKRQKIAKKEIETARRRLTEI